MRILVTGAAGFIGSRYVRMTLNGELPGGDRTRVTALDKLTYAGNPDNLPEAHDRMSFVEGDVCDYGLLRELLPGHDAVVHFAAESHVDRSILGAADFVETNVGGTQTLLEAVRSSGVERVVSVSTDEVYGSLESGSWREDSPLLPNSPYAASKAGADLIARSYWRTHGVNVTVTRCSNNYGPRQDTEKFVPLFVTRLLRGERPPLYGDGGNAREWIHVDDHCRAVQRVLERGSPGEVYNIGSGVERTNEEVVARLLDLCGGDWSMIRRVQDRKGHDLRYSVDDGKIREELGWGPAVDFDSGLESTVRWYRNNPGWWAHR